MVKMMIMTMLTIMIIYNKDPNKNQNRNNCKNIYNNNDTNTDTLLTDRLLRNSVHVTNLHFVFFFRQVRFPGRFFLLFFIPIGNFRLKKKRYVEFVINLRYHFIITIIFVANVFIINIITVIIIVTAINHHNCYY